jgi:hypothetical protein
MKTLLLLFLLSGDGKHKIIPNIETTVYICNSPGAKKYHLNKNCKGLSTCQHRIVKTTLEQAKKSGKTLCGWEKQNLSIFKSYLPFIIIRRFTVSRKNSHRCQRTFE